MAPHPKKTLIFEILDILEKYSDDYHTLTQQEIVDKLSLRGITVDRKSIKRNIEELIDMGYDILYTETKRYTKSRTTGELVESNIWTDFHIIRDFTDSELRLMITSLMAARNIPYKQSKDLVKKLEDLSSIYFHKRTNISGPSDNSANINQDLFETMEILEEAIAKNLQIRMNYADYQTDKKLHLRTSTAEWNLGEPIKYRISPYYIITNNARLYLIASSYSRKEWHLNFYRLDRVKNIELSEETRYPKENVDGLGPNFNLSKFIEEHLYMQYSETVPVIFKIKKKFLGELFDMFTGPISFSNETDTEVTVHTRVSYASMKSWAIQFSEHVIVTSPQGLVDDIKASLDTAKSQYLNESFST